MSCKVAIEPGRNMWMLARTDRDGATEEEVLQSALAFLQTVIGDRLKPYELIQIPDGRTDVATAVIGSARPVVITAVRGPKGGIPPGAPLQGTLVARQQDCDELYTIKATRPWWVRVGFDWRANRVEIPWPRLQVGTFGGRDTDEQFDNDWLLTEYRYAGEPSEDVTWGEAMIEEAGEAVEEAAENVTKGVKAIAPAIYALAAVIGGLVIYQIAKKL